MKNRWSEKNAVAFVKSCGEEVPAPLSWQIYATRLLGSETGLVLHGGGNTSVKTTAPDFLGEMRPALFIKASGSGMVATDVQDFIALDLDRLKKAIPMSDETMADFFTVCQLQPALKRPSIETLLHAFLPYSFVNHTHPTAILALTNRADADECLREAFGDTVTVISYPRVGYHCAAAAAEAVKKYPAARGLVIKHHGLVTWGKTVREAYDATIDIVTRAEFIIASKQVCSVAAVPAGLSSDKARERYAAIAPLLRGLLSPDAESADAPYKKMILRHVVSDELLGFLASPGAQAIAETAPLTPDYLIRTRRMPLFIGNPALDDAVSLAGQIIASRQSFIAEYRAFIAGHAPAGTPEHTESSLFPTVLLLPGIGAVCAGETANDARICADVTEQCLSVKQIIQSTGGAYADLGGEHLCDMEFRSYQRAKLSKHASRDNQLAGSVVLVTGAAGAIGSGLCASLLEAGCHVAVSDLAGPHLDQVVTEFGDRYGSSRVLGVGMDVTDQLSVAKGFSRIAETFGGLDGLVVNAGIAHVALIADLDIEAFRKLERVNVEGTLLCIREAGKLFALQKTGGDIVLISTKNVFAPGASFGAYSATKAAAHQIARIASLELAPISVRVNMVAPDAVFSHGEQKSGLWATVGPGRMKSRGLDEAGLEEYYRNRNLLKARVTANHVAAAVLFFLTRQTPTTGATIPVDGGLPDSTPR
ncbi:MAG: bifunctional aldolase/short-chain dehydrogenase [Chitinispirillaceae bacterium]|jgi:rhamnose utilization protein RhaD (predicted bifunctional aldolase and dehydrogenase)/NAD(P)-dependent dehydrogenase (short-subunit alcohol dehydrogenase family)|nr:bifunctional aldolase/short-chain dehydrogenase [Chitinispirillaceae bacterium]